MKTAQDQQKPAQRLPLAVKVAYRRAYARSSELGLFKNISLTGAFLQTHGPNIAPNDKLVFIIMVSGRERKVSAKVVWTNSLGCGIQFAPLNNRDTQIIDDLMYWVEVGHQDKQSLLGEIFTRVA